MPGWRPPRRIRAGPPKLGCGMLGGLLAATGDSAARGCRAGTAMRPSSSPTGTGPSTPSRPVTLNCAWYHCAACKHGLAPRDTELGVAGTPLSPGLTEMNDKVAAAGPFAGAARLLEHLAGVHLTVKRVERAAEASGAAQACVVRARAALIAGLETGADAAAACPGHARRRDRRHRRADDRKGDRRREGKGEDGRAAPARSSSRCSSPRTSWTRTATRSATGTPPASSPPSSQPPLRGPRQGQGHPPRRRSRPAANPHRRRRRLDLQSLAAATFPGPPASWTSTTPASTSTAWPAPGVHAR